MNKKVLTLCAGFMLASSVMASAAPQDYVPVKINQDVVGVSVTKLPEGNDGSLYHLLAAGYMANGTLTNFTDNKVLTLDEKGTINLVSLNGTGNGTVDEDNVWTSSLWCVNVTRTEANGQNPIFDFTNSLRGMMLSVSVEGYKGWTSEDLNGTKVYYQNVAPVSDGEVSGWKFYPVYDGMSGNWFLGSYVEGSVMAVLAWNSNTQNVCVKVVENATFANEVSGLLKFSLNKSVDKILTAEQFNSILGTQDAKKSVQLTFVKDANHPDFPNLFSQTKIKAEEVVGSDNAVTFYKEVQEAGSFNKYYLHVDTAYTNANASSKFLKFAYMDKAGVKFGANDANVESLGQFFIYYNATEKRIYLRAKGTIQKPDATNWWSQCTTEGTDKWSISDPINSLTNDYALKNWVDLQDLAASDDLRIITIKTDETSGIHTKVDFGFGSCSVLPSDKTSVENGLYVITNEKGQVLAAPINKNYGDGQVAEWVTLDAQDAQHMPAYQWAVTKTQKSDILLPTSPLMIVNREFTGLNESAIQLRNAENGAVIATGGTSSTNVDDLLKNAAGLTFTQITDKDILGDQYLGYKHLKSSDLMVTKYQFNYLNPFSMDQWISTASNNKDSVLYVTTEAVLFGLEEGSTHSYGVNADVYKETIPGLAQLVRTNYVVYNNSGKLVENKNNKFALGAGNYETAEVDTFFLKENNHYEGEHFYALVASNYANNTTSIANDAVKVGISDAGITPELSVEKLSETRTSAFAVKEAESPLYRRFNNAELEGNEGDASDTLRFVEKYRNEVLQIEGNENFKVKGIDFLGIYTEDKAPSGLSFIVDTAWVTRGLGYIKPQYLISIERNDIAATPGVPCDASNHQHVDANGNPTDAAHCVHATPATPGFRYGKYLVNFQDSVNAGKNEYAWKKYTRAGFVKAIQYGDSLYILKDQFAAVAKADVNEALLDEIIAANKVALAKGNPAYIVNLQGDHHKYVTWSMRYVKPGDASDKTFLFESMKKANDKDIAPEYAAWLKIQNGCLVLSDSNDSRFEEITGGDDALIFDVKYVEDDKIATENETISTSNVVVAGVNGAVVVKGAEGKSVIVSTILGKVVANEVVSSDNATIAAPAGVVVVSVDGESFKVVVK